IRRRFVDSARDIAARVDPGHAPRGWYQQPLGWRTLRGTLGRIENFDPRMIERRVLAIELPAEVSNLRHRATGRRIDYRDPIPQQFRMGYQRVSRGLAVGHVVV